MHRKILIGLTLSLAFVSLAYTSQDRPSLMTCGEALPENVYFSITMHGEWDSRESPIAGNISITLKDEITGETPHEIPESAEELVQCVKAAVGV